MHRERSTRHRRKLVYFVCNAVCAPHFAPLAPQMGFKGAQPMARADIDPALICLFGRRSSKPRTLSWVTFEKHHYPCRGSGLGAQHKEWSMLHFHRLGCQRINSWNA
eukprot:2799017-Amphidinium_carterae.1